MTDNSLMLAVLAMNAYDEGYGAGINVGDNNTGIGPNLGNAKVTTVVEQILSSAKSDGFAATAYTLSDGTSVIAYRGTDNPTLLNLLFPDGILGGSDLSAYPLAIGSYTTAQSIDAAQFYLAVLGTGSVNNITLTGNSLGGGLAGRM